MLSAPNYLVSFLESIHHVGGAKYVTILTRNFNVFDLIYTIRLTYVETSNEASLPGRDPLPFSCSFTFPP